MPLPISPKTSWSKSDINIITKYRQRIKDIEKENLEKKMLKKDVNSIDFYTITPKEELPKFLQKMKFQTLHSKENAGRDVKVFKKERQSVDEVNIRKKLKTAGNIMFLSEIYQSLGDSLEPRTRTQYLSNKASQSFGGDLQEWQKSRNTAIYQKLLIFKRRNNLPRRQSRIIQQKLSQLHRRNTTGRIVNYFKQGSNYRKQIEKQLDIIYHTHSSQTNQINKYILVENSSKLLKKQLDERYSHVEEEMKAKLKILNDTRIQHHNLFEEKTKLGIEQKQYNQQLMMKQQYGMTSTTTSYFGTPTAAKLAELKTQKRMQIQQIQSKIMKNKRIIQSLQNGIQECQQQLMSIMFGEVTYYKKSLRVGLDCRDTGLGWILKKLGELVQHKDYNNSKEMNKDSRDSNAILVPGSANYSSTILSHQQFAQKQQEYEFPLYLDKKSKEFLILKTHLEDQLEHLMEQKRKFVSQIGQSSSGQNSTNTQNPQNSNQKVMVKHSLSGTGFQAMNSIEMKDKIIEDDSKNDELPKRYRKSLKKLTILNQQLVKNQSLLQLQQRKASPFKKLQLSTNTDGLTGKKLYQTITQKIKSFDFTKAKKDKSLQLKNSKLMQYQNLLKSIKDIHIKLQDLDIQHENHLTSHYKESKDVFFEQCSACFGYKKSYSMIIKYFSWKSSFDEHTTL